VKKICSFIQRRPQTVIVSQLSETRTGQLDKTTAGRTAATMRNAHLEAFMQRHKVDAPAHRPTNALLVKTATDAEAHARTHLASWRH
jgi:hypothetical protein